MDNYDGIILALRLIASFSIEGKKEICRSGGVEKILLLLLSKQENIIRQSVQTVKRFIEPPTAETVNQGGFRNKLTKVIGGVTKLA